MIAIIDYGVGNLFSLSSSFKAIGADIIVTGDPEVIRKAEKLILPGVGAFRDAAEKLRASGLDKVIVEETATEAEKIKKTVKTNVKKAKSGNNDYVSKQTKITKKAGFVKKQKK